MQLSVIVNNKYTPLTHFVYVWFFLPFCAFCSHGPRGLICVNLAQSSLAECNLFSNYLPTALCPPHHDHFPTLHSSICFQNIQFIIYCITNSLYNCLLHQTVAIKTQFIENLKLALKSNIHTETDTVHAGERDSQSLCEHDGGFCHSNDELNSIYTVWRGKGAMKSMYVITKMCCTGKYLS